MDGRDATREMISYDKVDPLPTENPFYYKEDSAINKFFTLFEIPMLIFTINVNIISLGK